MATAQAQAHPTRLLELQRPLRPVQWAAILGSIVVVVWSVAGLIANPDFSTGDSATSVRVLGVDMNGWHAVSGFLIGIPGLYAALRPSWSGLFCLGAAGGLIITGIWALVEAQVYGVLYLPHGGADAALHFAVSAIFLAGAAHYFLIERTGKTA
jgi:hypothetical protein